MKIGIRDVVAYFRGGKVSTGGKLLGVFAVLYLLSPVDLVPDIVPLLGWLDDLGVLTLVVGYFVRQISVHRALQPAEAWKPGQRPLGLLGK